jgi:putative heme degradation protein
MSQAPYARTRLQTSVKEALDRATRFGKLMVTFSHGGATHERIGVIERVEEGQDGIRLAGAHHASLITPSSFVAVETDRSSKMKDKYYPRLVFCDAAGKAVFAVVGFEGLEPFDAALAGCTEEPLPAVEPAPRSAPTGEAPLSPALPFDALQLAQQSGEEVVIRHGTDGFRQEWRGKIGNLKPAMGFINIIDSDFHLHLKDGSVSAWQRTGPEAASMQTFAAVDTDGNLTGLTISGPASAFAAPAAGSAS